MPILNDGEEPHDWEMKDEEPPEQLQKKWEQEEARGPQTAVCLSCKKETPVGNLTCIFCGAMLSQVSCPGHCFLTWVKRLFKKG